MTRSRFSGGFVVLSYDNLCVFVVKTYVYSGFNRGSQGYGNKMSKPHNSNLIPSIFSQEVLKHDVSKPRNSLSTSETLP